MVGLTVHKLSPLSISCANMGHILWGILLSREVLEDPCIRCYVL